MISICVFCGDVKLVDGPRNKRDKGYCARPKCRKQALELLEKEGLLQPDELAELQASRQAT